MSSVRLLAVLGFTLLSACQSSPSVSSSAPPARDPAAYVAPARARELVTSGALLVDVRTPGEFESGHLDGAVNIPIASLESRLAEIPRNKPVVVYCAAGSRSSRAAGILDAAGYQVSNLGPMARWNQ